MASKPPTNYLPLVGVVCAPIFMWASWVSKSIVDLKEQNAFAKGSQKQQVSLASPAFNEKVNQLADVTLPVEGLLKRFGILKEDYGTDTHK